MKSRRSHIVGLALCVAVEVVLLAFVAFRPELGLSTEGMPWLVLAAALGLAIAEDLLGLREQSGRGSYTAARRALKAICLVLLWAYIIARFVLEDFHMLLFWAVIAAIITYKTIKHWK